MDTNSSAWAQQQWGECEFGDRRLTARAVRLGQALAAQPEASLPAQVGDPIALRGAYRLLNNARVSAEQLWQPHVQQTRQAARQQAVVLLVQDRTTLDFSHHPATGGLGPVGSRRQRGFFLQSVLAVVPDRQQVLGLAHAQVIFRADERGPQPKGKRHPGPEGQAWEASVAAIGSPPPGVTWVHVSDRESDIYEYLLACQAAQCHFVVRAYHDRRVEGTAAATPSLLEQVRAWAPASGAETTYTVTVAATAHTPKRQAQIVLQWGPFQVPAPKHVRPASTVPLWVVRAWEPNPPPDVEAVEWVLLTSWPVADAASARQVTHWYACRWLVEDYHQCLKTGCRMEASQLDHAADLQRLLGFLAPLAVRLLQLRQSARHQPDQPALEVVDPHWVRLLARHYQLDPARLSASEFFRQVAKLGGHQGRKGDGAPGWRTLWKGWARLSQWAHGAGLA